MIKLSVAPFTFAVAKSLFEIPGFVMSTRVLPVSLLGLELVPVLVVPAAGVVVAGAVPSVYSAVIVTLFPGIVKVVGVVLTLARDTPGDSVTHLLNTAPAAGVLAVMTTGAPFA